MGEKRIDYHKKGQQEASVFLEAIVKSESTTAFATKVGALGLCPFLKS